VFLAEVDADLDVDMVHLIMACIRNVVHFANGTGDTLLINFTVNGKRNSAGHSPDVSQERRLENSVHNLQTNGE
jgi:hypothetical protein